MFFVFREFKKVNFSRARSVFFLYSLTWLSDTEDDSLCLAGDREATILSTHYPGALGPARKGGTQWAGTHRSPSRTPGFRWRSPGHTGGWPHVRPATLPGPRPLTCPTSWTAWSLRPFWLGHQQKSSAYLQDNSCVSVQALGSSELAFEKDALEFLLLTGSTTLSEISRSCSSFVTVLVSGRGQKQGNLPL